MATELKDYLLDIVKNTMCVDPSTIVKVTGTTDSTTLKARREDGTIILEGTLNNPVADLNGVFGIGNLPMLSGLLNFSNFKSKEAKVKLTREVRKEVEIPTEIVFGAPKSASASFRLVHEAAIPKQYNHQDFDWAIVVDQPHKIKIAEFAQLATVYSHQEEYFTVQVQDKELGFYIGKEDSSSHNAKFTFAENVEGKIKSGFSWRIGDILTVLKLSESAKSTLRINDLGNVIQIDIDTGLCKYQFMFPGKN